MRDADIQAHNDLSSMLVMRPQERGKPRRCNLLLSQHSMQAQIVDLELKGNTPVIPKVFVAVDCGKSRSCQDYGRRGIVNGIGNAFFGDMTFQDAYLQRTILIPTVGYPNSKAQRTLKFIL